MKKLLLSGFVLFSLSNLAIAQQSLPKARTSKFKTVPKKTDAEIHKARQEKKASKMKSDVLRKETNL